MMDASPRETLPKNLCPAETSSPGSNVSGPGWRCGGGTGAGCWYCCCGGGNGAGCTCCAEADTVQHISAANVPAARREANVMKEPLASKSGRRLNLTPTSMALGCAQCPLDSHVIGTNYDGTTAGKIRFAPRNSPFCLISRLFCCVEP